MLDTFDDHKYIEFLCSSTALTRNLFIIDSKLEPGPWTLTAQW